MSVGVVNTILYETTQSYPEGLKYFKNKSDIDTNLQTFERTLNKYNNNL